MKESKFRELFAPTIVLVCIGLVASLLLAVTFQITQPRIEAITVQRATEARTELIPAASGFHEMEDIELVDGVDEVYAADDETGYVITSHAKGFGGTVTVMTAVDMQGRIINVKVTDASDETPGLGSKATVPAHTDQYAGAASITNSAEDPDGKYIQAVTGASYTSRAVFNAVSAALQQAAAILGR